MTLNSEFKSILEKSFINKKFVYFSSANLAITFQTLLLEIHNHKLILKNTIPPHYISNFLHSKSFHLQIYTLKFQTDEIKSDGENMVFVLKKQEMVKEIRKETRFFFSHDENGICQFINPFDEKTLIRKKIIEMSSLGLSIQIQKESRLFNPGVIIPQSSIFINEQLHSTGDVEVIYQRKLIDIKSNAFIQIGMKILS